MTTKYYGVFDRQGTPMAFYAEGINQIPKGAQPVSQEDWKRYLSGRYLRNKDGVCVEKEPLSDEVLLSQAIAVAQGRLNAALTTYIYSKYDAGTQASFTALYALETTPQEIKNGILLVWEWIRSVMVYYYGRKSTIAALSTVNAVNKATWNFAPFDETLPAITLASIYSML